MKKKKQLNNIQRLELLRVKRTPEWEQATIKICLSERGVVVRLLEGEHERNLAFSKKAWSADRVKAFMLEWRNTAIHHHKDFEIDPIVLTVYGDPFPNKTAGKPVLQHQPIPECELIEVGGLVTHPAMVAEGLLLTTVG